MSKVFYRKFSTVSGERWDPNTYHYERINAITKLQNSSFKLEKLKLITSLAKKIVVSNDDNLPYIGLNNIESNTGIYIKKEEKETFSSAIQFKKGQVLFPKLRPYLNKVYFADFNGLCSTEFHIFDSHVINNKYLSIFLRSSLVLSQTKHLMSGNTLPRLQTEDIENLLIPIPPDYIQNKIIQKMNDAYQQKQQKEKEAKEKLDSIDDYLLDALGIKLPEKQDESVEGRVFFRKFSELKNRLDPLYYQNIYNDIIVNSNYTIEKIKDKCTFVPGYAFKSSDYVDNSNTILITIKNIFKNSIQLKKVTYLPNSYFEMYSKYKIKSNDLLIAMTGATIGKVGLFDINEKNALLNQRNGIIRSSKLNTNYLMNLLNTDLYQNIILLNSVGGAQPNISETGITNLNIPIPPIEKQNALAKHIQKLREDASELKKSANSIYHKAQQEVEKMILGVE